jgi:hypothetical protein
MMTRVPVATRCSLRWHGLALMVSLALQGCGAQAPGAGSTAGGIAGEAAGEIPPGAIPIGGDLYQVPIGADDAGCPRYRLYSPTRLVAQVIYYRDRAGGFTTDRQQAACARAAPD